LRFKQTALALFSAFLLGAVFVAYGCGGDSDTTAGGETTSTAAKNGGEGAGGEQGKGGGKAGKQSNSEEGGGAGRGGGSEGGHQNFNREPTKKEVADFKAPPGGDNSIQTYGDVVEGDDEEEIVSSMRAFFRAIANLDYPGICAGLTEENKKSFEKFLKLKKEEGNCASFLKDLLQPAAAPEARRAANGVVYQVRSEDGNAFILFTPEDGVASYFVMKQEEDGSWKATGLSTGTPFDPMAAAEG
jgi:hypothetical protein